MTELIAKIAGLYLLTTGIGFIISRKFYDRMTAGAANADPVLLNLSGATHFIVGMLILVNHFRWGSAAEIAVSLLGLAAVAKGAVLIAIPELTLKTSQDQGRGLTFSTIGFVALGAYLTFVGFSPLLGG